jgi:hypothetical protein
MRKLHRRLRLEVSLIAAALCLLAGLPAAAFAETVVESPSGSEASSPGWEGGGTVTPPAATTPPPVRQGSSVGSGGVPQTAPTPAPEPAPEPAPAPAPAPPSEAPSYPTESSGSSDYVAPQPSSPEVVEEAATPPVATPAPAPKPEPAPAPKPEKAAPVDLAAATPLTSSSPSKSAEANSETPYPVAAAPSADDQSGSSFYVLPLLLLLALCVLGLLGVQLRRFLRYRQIEAVKRERAATWDAAVQQIEVRRALDTIEPSADGLQKREAPDHSTHLAA